MPESEEGRKVPFEFTQKEFSDIYIALTKPDFYKDYANKEYVKQAMDRRKALGKTMMAEVKKWIDANTTIDDKGVVHIPIFIPKYRRIFTYSCRTCGDNSLKIESDDGHKAWDYFKKNHRCDKK